MKLKIKTIAELQKKINWMDRQEVVALLEGVSIACYDHESTDELRSALLENVKDGTIELGDA